MGILATIAGWLNPELPERFADLENKLIRSEVDYRNTLFDLETYKRSTENLATKLAETAKTINELRDHRKRLREELLIARQYVLDTSNELDDELDGLGPRSRKRTLLEATLAAVNADLKRIADLLVETSK